MIGFEIAAIVLAIGCGLAMVIVATGWTVGRAKIDEPLKIRKGIGE